MNISREQIINYMILSLITALLSFIFSPKFITLIGIISGGISGFLFVLIGLPDKYYNEMNRGGKDE